MSAYTAGQEVLCGDYYQYTPSGAARFKKAGRWTTTPSMGYIAFFYSSSLGRIGHTGIVTKVTHNADDGTWTISTIEGNTSGTYADRNGGEVRAKTYPHVRIGGTNWFCGFGIPRYGADTTNATDLIEIARGEVGYEEKASNKDLEDPHANAGRANYTKYSSFCPWFSSPAQWCGQFVSWCVYQACVQNDRYASRWEQQPDGSWKYLKPSGAYAHDEWQYINGRWYVFSGDGTMITGWFDDGAAWYYLADDGAMCSSQWIQYQDNWYYLTSSGAMAKDAYVDCSPLGWCYLDSSGQWDGRYVDKPQGPGAVIAG